MLLVLSGFLLVGRQFISLWVGDEYEISYYATLILMLAGYIPAVQTLGVNIQNAKNMHRMRSIVYFCVACVNVISSIFLIKMWGVIGTCLGTLFATLLGHGYFMNYYYYHKIGLNIFIFWKEMFKWLIPVSVLTIVSSRVLKFVVIDSWIRLIGFVVYMDVFILFILY